MKTILVLNWRDLKHPEAGGAEIHFHEIFKRLAAKGYKVLLLTTRFPGCTNRDVQNGIEVFRLGSTFLFNWEAPFLIRKLCRQYSIDCIIDDVNKIPFFTPRFFPKIPCGAFYHHLFGKTVYELAAWPMASYVLLLERLSKIGYGRTPICTVSPSTRLELLEMGFRFSQIAIIENSVDTQQYTISHTVTKEPDLLMYAGRLKRYKNIHMIFDAMSILCKNNRILRCVIAGSGDDEPRLREHAKNLGLAEAVEFKGFITEAEKIDLYRRAILFVNPSQKEGWGITCIESSACGTPIVANNVPGLRDSVKNGITGLLFDENNTESCAVAISTLLDDTTKYAHMVTEGRNWAASFSWDTSALRMEEWLLNTVCAKHS